MSAKIEAEAKQRGITRLCHFTPSRNLGQILAGNIGVLATKSLREDERQVYTATDLQRLDGHLGHVCCSIEYPNAWYFEKARLKEVIFRDWVVLFIDRTYLWKPGTRFCHRNAAASFGREVIEGEAGFRRLFAEKVTGAYGKTYVRTAQRLTSCPTDEQAEVLVPDSIGLNDILGIALRSEEQAQNELVRLHLLNIGDRCKSLRLVVAPDLWDKHKLSTLLSKGQRPRETEFTIPAVP